MKAMSVVMFACFSILAGCAHHRDVRPGDDGVNYVVVRAPTRSHAEERAIGEANDYCESIQKQASFVSEKSNYKGTMDEGTRETVRNASTAAMVLGSGAGVFARDPGVRVGGGLLGTAGTAGAIMTNGDDYVSEMHFRCK